MPLDLLEIEIISVLALRSPFSSDEIAEAYVYGRSFDLLIKALPLAAAVNKHPLTVVMELKEFNEILGRPFDGDTWAELCLSVYGPERDEKSLELIRVIR